MTFLQNSRFCFGCTVLFNIGVFEVVKLCGHYSLSLLSSTLHHGMLIAKLTTITKKIMNTDERDV